MDNIKCLQQDSFLTPQASKEDALLLAYLASRNRSLFAAQCFVETVLECYFKGDRVDDVEMGLQLKNLQVEPRLLSAQDQDILLTWLMIIMLTAKDVGLPRAAAAGQAPAAGDAGALATPPADAGSSGGGSGAGSGGGADADSSGGSTLDFGGITERYSAQVLGLLAYVKQALGLYKDQGYTLQRLTDLQAAATSQEAGGGRSQFLELMQQYSRLVLITLEVAAAMKLPTQLPLDNPVSLRAPSGYTDAFLGAPAAAEAAAAALAAGAQPQVEGGGQGPAEAEPGGKAAQAQEVQEARGSAGGLAEQGARGLRGVARAQAVRLMTAFVAAAIGSDYATSCFASYALAAYRLGLPAVQLYRQLDEREFLQAGGLGVPVYGPGPPQEVNAKLFGTWLSCAYMAAAQLGVPFPGAEAAPVGWAWAGAGDEVEANGLALFTARVLARAPGVAEAARAAGDEAAAAAGGGADGGWPDDPLLARITGASEEGAAALEAQRVALAEELQSRGTLKGKPLPPLVRVADEELAATSSAVRVWQQQVQVVEAVAAHVVAEVQQQR